MFLFSFLYLFFSDLANLLHIRPRQSGNILLEGLLSILFPYLLSVKWRREQKLFMDKRNRPNPYEATNIGFFAMVIHVGRDKKIIFSPNKLLT